MAVITSPITSNFTSKIKCWPYLLLQCAELFAPLVIVVNFCYLDMGCSPAMYKIINEKLICKSYKLSVIRQKGKSQNGCFKKTKHVKFSTEQTWLTPWYTHVHVRIRKWNMFVFRKIWCTLFSWNTRFEICPFALLPTKYWKDIFDKRMANLVDYLI